MVRIEEPSTRERAPEVPLEVAASIGPYSAMLADGSEYSWEYGVSDSTLRDFHGPRLEVLAGAGADLLALERLQASRRSLCCSRG